MFTRLGIRLGLGLWLELGLVFLGLGISISILSVRCYSTAGTQYLVVRVPVIGTVDRTQGLSITLGSVLRTDHKSAIVSINDSLLEFTEVLTNIYFTVPLRTEL